MKQIRPAIFGLVLLTFFLPWVTVSCQQQKVITLSGIQLVTGTEINQPGSGMFGAQQKTQKMGGEIFAIVAFAVTGIGLLFSFASKVVSCMMSVLSIGSVVFLKNGIEQKILKEGSGMFQVQYESGFYAAIALLIGVFIVSFISKDKEIASGIYNASSVTDIPDKVEDQNDLDIGITLKAYPSNVKNIDSKICPMCAETVKAAALKCKHCQHLFEAKEEKPYELTISPPEAINEVVTQAPITNYADQPEESRQSHEKTATEQLSTSVPASNSNTFAYGACFVFLIVAIIGGTYLYKTKADTNKLPNLKGNRNAAAPTGNQPANTLASQIKENKYPNKEDIISKLIGNWNGYTIWYDNQDGKYKQGAEQHCQIIRDAKGVKFIGQNGQVLDEDNAYLSYKNGKFYGSYLAGKHGGTHGQLFTVKFTLKFKDDNTLLYQDPTWKHEYKKA